MTQRQPSAPQGHLSRATVSGSLFGLDGRVALIVGTDVAMRKAVRDALTAAGASLADSRATAQSGFGMDASLSAIADLTSLDILVNLVGFDRGSALDAVSEQELDSAIEGVVEASFLISQAAAAKMRSKRAVSASASIVHVVTPLASIGAADRSVCCMAMHALRGLAMASAVELGPMDIRVNLLEACLDEGRERALSHAATVEGIGAGVVYLSSPAAAAMTGTRLVLDAGWIAR